MSLEKSTFGGKCTIPIQTRDIKLWRSFKFPVTSFVRMTSQSQS
ncbi:hypothetical protein BVRB_7g174360 [Beta vulgaris subsp. vulgaris]|nr:hypothetical protein BVRB_7g174360 [Beta vulgaris subsp. vulgaris]